MMNCDSAFCIGKTHSVCQDYAISCAEIGYAIGIVSDGCSSSIHTDIGSRILATTFYKNRLLNFGSPPGTYNNAEDIYNLKQSRSITNELLLPSECLDATMMTVDVYDHKEFIFTSWGDGAFVIGFEDGSMIIRLISYPSGYPHYINYELSEARRKGFDEVDQGTYVRIISTHDRNSFADITISVKTPYVVYSDVEKYYDEYGKKVKFLAVLSDGISSFYEKKNNETYTENITLTEIEVLKSLLSFKSFNGEFVQRRLKRFNKNCAAKNWEHYDDLSLSVVALD